MYTTQHTHTHHIYYTIHTHTHAQAHTSYIYHHPTSASITPHTHPMHTPHTHTLYTHYTQTTDILSLTLLSPALPTPRIPQGVTGHCTPRLWSGEPAVSPTSSLDRATKTVLHVLLLCCLLRIFPKEAAWLSLCGDLCWFLHKPQELGAALAGALANLACVDPLPAPPPVPS